MLRLFFVHLHCCLPDQTVCRPYKQPKQGVAVTGRNTTGPPRRRVLPPGELRCAVMECYRRRQTTDSKTLQAPTLCVGRPVTTIR